MKTIFIPLKTISNNLFFFIQIFVFFFALSSKLSTFIIIRDFFVFILLFLAFFAFTHYFHQKNYFILKNFLLNLSILIHSIKIINFSINCLPLPLKEETNCFTIIVNFNYCYHYLYFFDFNLNFQ